MDSAAQKKWIFKVPIAGWFILALWALLNLLGLYSAGISSHGLGILTGRIVFPFVFAWILTYPLWFLFRRSQKAASIIFLIVLAFIILASFGSQLPKK